MGVGFTAQSEGSRISCQSAEIYCVVCRYTALEETTENETAQIAPAVLNPGRARSRGCATLIKLASIAVPFLNPGRARSRGCAAACGSVRPVTLPRPTWKRCHHRRFS